VECETSSLVANNESVEGKIKADGMATTDGARHDSGDRWCDRWGRTDGARHDLGEGV